MDTDAATTEDPKVAAAAEKAAAKAAAKIERDAAAAEKAQRDMPAVETAVEPEPIIAEDGMSILMPEGHTVHLETRHPSAVDPNLRMTADGKLLTSADSQ